MDIIESLTISQTIINTQIELLCKMIEDCPDNPRIIRTEKNPNCYTVNAIYLLDPISNWTASYHDFKLTSRMLADNIRQGDPRTVVERLETIIEQGWFCCPSTHKYYLHPDIIAYLKKIVRKP